MKRFFIFLLVVLLVLTSCSTGKVSKEEPEVEVVTATPEKAPTVELPATEPAEQPQAQEQAEVPAAETEQPQQPEAIIEVLPEDEKIVVEETGPIDEATAEEIVEALVEQDWSKVITATAPAEEKPAAEGKPAEAAKPAETQASQSSQAAEPAQQSAQAAQPAQTAEPEQTAQTTQKLAEKKGTTLSKIAAFFSKVGNFVMKEKLLSIGILVCCVGVVYLIIALFISRHPKKPKHRHHAEASYQEGEEGDQEEDSSDDDDDSPVQEDVAAGEDDEFLRSLLGEDKK